jgi:hypothetical protein
MDNYFHTSVPDPGKEWDFKPDPNLASVQYYRCSADVMAQFLPVRHSHDVLMPERDMIGSYMVGSSRPVQLLQQA